MTDNDQMLDLKGKVMMLYSAFGDGPYITTHRVLDHWGDVLVVERTKEVTPIPHIYLTTFAELTHGEDDIYVTFFDTQAQADAWEATNHKAWEAATHKAPPRKPPGGSIAKAERAAQIPPKDRKARS